MQNRTPSSSPEKSSSKGKSIGRFFRKLAIATNTGSSSAEPGTSSSQANIAGRPRRHHIPTEEDLENNATVLQGQIDAAWATRHKSRYRQARALLVCWADNEVSAAATLFKDSASRSSTEPSPQAKREGPFKPAAFQLQSVLERRYGIDTQVWLIPTLENPQDMLVGKIAQFVEQNGGPDNLLIFWYGGSAEFVQAGDGGSNELVWYGLRDDLGISARAATKALGKARADVLMLNDSPFAQCAYTGHIEGPGTFELLGSGSMVPSTSIEDLEREASFTRTLALMLDSPFLADQGVSTMELHRKLLDAMTGQRPLSTIATPTTPSLPQSGSQQFVRPRRPLSTQSISQLQATGAPSYPIICQISASAYIERGAAHHIVLSRLDGPLGPRAVHVRDNSEPRVQLEIRLARPFINIQQWKDWILRAPGDAEEVTFTVCKKTGK